MPGEAGRAPLARRRERHLCLARPPGRRRESLPDGGQRGVLVLFVGERAERGLGRRLSVERDQGVERDGAVGQGAGLVETDNVDPGQALDRGKLLHQHPAPGQGDRGHAEGDAGQQHQSLRDHADQRGDRPGQRLPRRVVHVQLADHHERGHRDDRPGNVTQDPVDALHKLRAHQRETPRLGGQLAGVRGGAHLGGLITAGPGHHKAAGQHAVTGPLVHRLGLAGQQRLIRLQAHAGAHHPVRYQLVAGPQVNQVTGDQPGDGYLARCAVTDHFDAGRAEHGEPVQGQLGAQLLADTDQRVRHQHDAEQGILRLAHGQDHGQQRTQDEVEPGQDVGAQDLARPTGWSAPRLRSPARASVAPQPPRCSARRAGSLPPAWPVRLRLCRPHGPCPEFRRTGAPASEAEGPRRGGAGPNQPRFSTGPPSGTPKSLIGWKVRVFRRGRLMPSAAVRQSRPRRVQARAQMPAAPAREPMP